MTDKQEISLYIDPGTASTQEVGEFLTSLNILNRAAGGNGLNFAIAENQPLITFIKISLTPIDR